MIYRRIPSIINSLDKSVEGRAESFDLQDRSIAASTAIGAKVSADLEIINIVHVRDQDKKSWIFSGEIAAVITKEPTVENNVIGIIDEIPIIGGQVVSAVVHIIAAIRNRVSGFPFTEIVAVWNGID